MRSIRLGAASLAVTVGSFLVPSAAASPPRYVGAAQCVSCHPAQAQLWQRSHHALAMQQASSATALGDFSDRSFTHGGVVSTFSSRAGPLHVRTEGPRGSLEDYPIAYTFGAFPLQQYLIRFPGGRLQSLGIAWDSRASGEGGQRWLHLYPGQPMPPSDPLHWTGRNQTWNFMCADCHSTHVEKGYTLRTDSYATKWSDLNVACEACHGPGSEHVRWAKSLKPGAARQPDDRRGLVVSLAPPEGAWSLRAPADLTRHWQGQHRTDTELDTCAPCHARRHPITAEHQPGQAFLDAFTPALLDEGVYFADGQVQEEDYEYGSFVQSKMRHEGVTCSNCHEPHGLKLAADAPNAVCGQCHQLSAFATPGHHHHKADSAGALCINCHMPPRTYMVVDVRRDHSFRVPRPDLSVRYGTPNACTQCHTSSSAGWAAAAVAGWYGPKRRQEPHFVEALDAARKGGVGAEAALAKVISDGAQPGIARATALSLLPHYLTAVSFQALRSSLHDGDPLVRLSAVRALGPLTADQRAREAAPLLTDPVRSVRIEAARLLAGAPTELVGGTSATALTQATNELIASELASSERPESHENLALIDLQMGRLKDAEDELNTALRLDPDFVPAMVNLADLYRVEQREDLARKWLQTARERAPNAAEPVYALGLLEVRQKHQTEALNLLTRAAALQPENARYAYVYAVALHSAGDAKKAISVLAAAHLRRPADRDVLSALIAFERDAGDTQAAVAHARQLTQLAPKDPNALALLADLLQR
jgi:Flp pilus assembly protein TadD